MLNFAPYSGSCEPAADYFFLSFASTVQVFNQTTSRRCDYLRKQCKRPVHFWPFDGWEVPEGK
jgi:hypothetical protein